MNIYNFYNVLGWDEIKLGSSNELSYSIVTLGTLFTNSIQIIFMNFLMLRWNEQSYYFVMKILKVKLFNRNKGCIIQLSFPIMQIIASIQKQ